MINFFYFFINYKNGRNFVDWTSKTLSIPAGQNGLDTIDFSTATVGNGTAWLEFIGASITVRQAFIVAKHDAATFSDFDGLFETIDGSWLAGQDGGSTWFDGAFSFAGYYENLVNRVNSDTTTLDSWTVHTLEHEIPFASTQWTIGHDGGFENRNWEGQVGEVIAYETALGSTDRNQLITDLKTKWAIT